MRHNILSETESATDPIDDLVPPPAPWFVRLLLGCFVVAAVAVVAYQWGQGAVYPKPSCCGSSGATHRMERLPNGSVAATALFDNMSPHDLRITDASADLAGSRVVAIDVLDDDNAFSRPLGQATSLPHVVPGDGRVFIRVVFEPDSCEPHTGDWGEIALDLEVANSWLPTIGRRYELPDPIFTGPGSLSADPQQIDEDTWDLTAPEIACALAGRN